MNTTAIAPVSAVSSGLLTALTQQLQADLTTPRAAHPQMLAYLADTFNTPLEKAAEFISTQLAEQDIYQLDIAFSPQFTPKLPQRLPYAQLLQAEPTAALNPEQIQQLINQLIEANLKTPLELPTGETAQCPLLDLFVERYVSRLHLGFALPALVLEAIALWPQAEQPHLQTLSRDGLLQTPHKAQLFALALNALPKATLPENQTAVSLAEFALDNLRTYRPKTVSDWQRQLAALAQSCEDDAALAETRSYHHHELKAANAGSDKDLHQAQAVRAHYQQLKAQALTLAACL